jgi:hypothetical protein
MTKRFRNMYAMSEPYKFRIQDQFVKYDITHLTITQTSRRGISTLEI